MTWTQHCNCRDPEKPIGAETFETLWFPLRNFHFVSRKEAHLRLLCCFHVVLMLITSCKYRKYWHQAKLLCKVIFNGYGFILSGDIVLTLIQPNLILDIKTIRVVPDTPSGTSTAKSHQVPLNRIHQQCLEPTQTSLELLEGPWRV